ncbi:hypothetical protein FRC17_005476 [Serendipita sp. 399]|nr:hypothetical protein FRC17_005476 [Serendipita sp. 399]
MSYSHLSIPKFDQDPQNFSRSQAPSEDNDNKSHFTIRKAESRTSLCSYRSSRDLLDFVKDISGRMYSSMSDLYVLPSDQEEWGRLNKLHDALLLTLGHLCPDMAVVDSVLTSANGALTSALDLGCGTGRWCNEIGRRYPNINIVGVDLAPYPLDPDKTVQHCHFELDNIDLGLSHFFDQFDLVHARCIELGLSDYKKLIEEAIFCLRPGGLLILAEIEWQIYEEDMQTPVSPASEQQPDGSWVQRFLQEAREAACRNGSDLLVAHQTLQEGLWDKPNIDNESCRSASLYIPLSNEIGERGIPRRMNLATSLMKQNLMMFHRNLYRLLRANGVPQETLDEWSLKADNELERGDKRRWVRVQYAWGRRNVSPTPSPSSTDAGANAATHLESHSEQLPFSAEMQQILGDELAPYPYLFVSHTQEEAKHFSKHS